MSTSLSIGDWRFNSERELITATDRKMSVNLLDPSTITFTLNGNHLDAQGIREGISDIWWRRDGILLYRGRIVETTDQLDETSYTVSCTCTDYRGLLGHRIIFGDQVYTSQEQANIALALITYSQSIVGGNMNLTKGSWPNTGQNATMTFRDGQTIWEALKSIITSNVGPDIIIDENKIYTLYYPQYAPNAASPTTLDYGGVISKVTRNVDMDAYANAIRQNGEAAATPVNITAPDIATRNEGRWDASFADPTLVTAATVSAAAQFNFNSAYNILPTYTLTFAPGQWRGPDHVWIGDTVDFSVRKGRLNLVDPVRVYSLSITLDANDVETVTLTVGRPKVNPFKKLASQISNLNRR